MGDEKAKLGLAFMYQAPGSLKDNQDKERVEETQHVEISNSKKAFRPETANLRCLKCKRLGHLNTDKVCPLYGKSRLDVDDDKEIAPEIQEETKVEIKNEPKEYISEIKENLPAKSNSEEITLDMLRALSKKEKKVLLKRLKKLEKKFKKKSH